MSGKGSRFLSQRVRLSQIDPLALLRAVLIPLAISWLVALIFANQIVREQMTDLRVYDARALAGLEGQRSLNLVLLFAPQQAGQEYQVRVDRGLLRGMTLILPQMAVLAGLLSWQVIITARRSYAPLLHGGLAGAIVGVVQGGIALVLQAALPLVIVLIALLIGTGFAAGWSSAGKAEASVTAGIK